MQKRFLACFGFALLVYVPRAYRTLCLAGDSAELVTAAASWGVPHAPGYPLYTLVGHALARLPWFELPFRVHLSSAIFHAATIAVVARAIERITGRTGPALLGAATLVLSRVFFVGSLYAEVFPLNDLLFATLLLLAVSIANDARPSPRRWGALAVVAGLAASHHPMIALGFPAIAVLVAPAARGAWRRRPWFFPGLTLLAIAVSAAPWALAMAAAARDPLISWGDVHDLRSLLDLVTRHDYGGLFHPSRRPAAGQLLERLDAFALSTGQSFGMVGLVLAVLGVVWSARHARRAGLALGLAFALAGPLFAAMNAVDIHSEYRRAFFERFFTMSHLPVALFVGFGATHVFDRIRSAPRWSRGFRFSMLAGLLSVLAVVPLIVSTRDLDFSRNRLGIGYAHDLIASTPERSLVLLKGDMATQAALYVCGVERRCGERVVFAPLQLALPWRLAQIRRRHPELGLADEDPRDFAEGEAVARLVRRELATRPVVVHSELLDDALRGEQSALPWMLLYRIYPDERALRDDLAEFRALRSGGAGGFACEGCAAARTTWPHSALDAQIREAYAAALRSSQSAAGELGSSAP